MIAQKEFEGIYNELFKLDYLPNGSESGLVVKGKINKYLLHNGPVLLNLIDWLNENKKNDPTGMLLLRKLNRYLYLQFRHFVGQLNINKKYEGRLVGLVHDIYKFKVPSEFGSAEEKLNYTYPFQAALSKIVLFTFIINASGLTYEEKVENLAYFLDKMRRELLAIKSHYDNCKLRTVDITDFIEFLQTYAAKEPIIGPNYLKFFFVTIIVVGVVSLVVWFVWKKVMPNWDQILDYSSTRAHEMYVRLLDPIADIFADKLGEKFRQKAHMVVTDSLNAVHDSGARFVPGCPIVPTRIDVPGGGEAAPDLAQVAQANIDPAATVNVAQGGSRGWFGGWF